MIKNKVIIILSFIILFMTSCPNVNDEKQTEKSRSEKEEYLISAFISDWIGMVKILDESMMEYSEAIVILDGVTLTYEDTIYFAYVDLDGELTTAAGDTVNISITINNFTSFASVVVPGRDTIITNPTSLDTWNSNEINTVNWSSSSTVDYYQVKIAIGLTIDSDGYSSGYLDGNSISHNIPANIFDSTTGSSWITIESINETTISGIGCAAGSLIKASILIESDSFSIK